MMRILDVQARLFVDEDFFTFVDVGGCIIPIGTIRVSALELLERADRSAREQFARAQTGPQPGPGGMYPEGSQG